ncbi:MAG: ATP-binding cassette domain-containing protein [Acidiferrobacter sp.]
MLDCRIVKTRRDVGIDVAFCAAPGARLGLAGASGAGKSTVLSCVAGLEAADGGHVRFGTQQWFPPFQPAYRRTVGYLTQRERLFPHLTVGENIVFGLNRREQRTAAAWIDEIRTRLKLDTLWAHAPDTLSGGQIRRVALARTLCRRPPLLLLDEPFTGLDRPTVEEMMSLLLDWQAQLSFTLVLVDHDATVLGRLCTDQITLVGGRIRPPGVAAAGDAD